LLCSLVRVDRGGEGVEDVRAGEGRAQGLGEDVGGRAVHTPGRRSGRTSVLVTAEVVHRGGRAVHTPGRQGGRRVHEGGGGGEGEVRALDHRGGEERRGVPGDGDGEDG